MRPRRWRTPPRRRGRRTRTPARRSTSSVQTVIRPTRARARAARERVDRALARDDARRHELERGSRRRRPSRRPARRRRRDACATGAVSRTGNAVQRSREASSPRDRRSARAYSAPPRDPSRSGLPQVEDHGAHARSTSHARRMSASVVRALPIASRMTSRPRSFVVATKSSPVAVARPRDLVVVALDVPEADGRERVRRDDLPPGLRLDQLREELREPDMLADQRPQPFGAVPAQHRPELERAEPSPERRAVVLDVDGRRRSRRGTRATSANASWNASGRRVQSAEQSIGVKSHLCGLTTTESARSTPSRHQRNSGHTAAEPA